MDIKGILVFIVVVLAALFFIIMILAKPIKDFFEKRKRDK